MDSATDRTGHACVRNLLCPPVGGLGSALVYAVFQVCPHDLQNPGTDLRPSDRTCSKSLAVTGKTILWGYLECLGLSVQERPDRRNCLLQVLAAMGGADKPGLKTTGWQIDTLIQQTTKKRPEHLHVGLFG